MTDRTQGPTAPTLGPRRMAFCLETGLHPTYRPHLSQALSKAHAVTPRRQYSDRFCTKESRQPVQPQLCHTQRRGAHHCSPGKTTRAAGGSSPRQSCRSRLVTRILRCQCGLRVRGTDSRFPPSVFMENKRETATFTFHCFCLLVSKCESKS